MYDLKTGKLVQSRLLKEMNGMEEHQKRLTLKLERLEKSLEKV